MKLPMFLLEWLGIAQHHVAPPLIVEVVFHDDKLHDLRNKAASALAANRFTARSEIAKLNEISAAHEGQAEELQGESRKVGAALGNALRRQK